VSFDTVFFKVSGVCGLTLEESVLTGCSNIELSTTNWVTFCVFISGTLTFAPVLSDFFIFDESEIVDSLGLVFKGFLLILTVMTCWLKALSEHENTKKAMRRGNLFI